MPGDNLACVALPHYACATAGFIFMNGAILLKVI